MAGVVQADEVNYAGTNTGLAGDDYVGGPFPIGFNFTYYGNTYTEGYPSTNGIFSFPNSDNFFWGNDTLASSNSWPNTIYPFWDDLITKNFTDASLYYTTIGTAPHRQFIMQWTNMYFYFNSDIPMGTFQMILDEGTNVIHFQYRDLLGGSTSLGDSATIGIKGNDDTQFNEVSLNNPSLTQGQAITFTPNGDSYDVDTNANYEQVYVVPPGVPISPTLINPIDGLTGTITAPTFEWEPVDLATSYSLLISDKPDFSTTIVNETGLTGTTYTLSTPLDYSTQYYWKVEAVNDFGGSYSTTRTFTTASQSFPVPDTPSGLTGGVALSGGRINLATLLGASVKMRLTDPDITQQVRYRLQVSPNSDFTNPTIDYRSPYRAQGSLEQFNYGLDTGTYLVGNKDTTLVDGQDYYVRVNTEDIHAQSSDWASLGGIAFTYDISGPTTPEAPTLVGAAATTTNLSWNPVAEDYPANPFYKLEYSSDPAFSTFTSINTNSTTATLAGLSAGTYYARIIATDSASNSSTPSPSLEFRVQEAVFPPTTPATTPNVPVVPNSTPTRPTVATSTTLPPAINTAQPTTTSASHSLIVHIVDGNNNPVQGALVTLHSIVQTAYTDSSGNATFNNVDVGTHQVEAQYNSMHSQTTLYVANDSQTQPESKIINVSLRLVKASIVPQPIKANQQYWIWAVVAAALLLLFIIVIRRLKRKHN